MNIVNDSDNIGYWISMCTNTDLNGTNAGSLSE